MHDPLIKIYYKEGQMALEHDYLKLLVTTLTPDFIAGDYEKIYLTLDTIAQRHQDWQKIILQDYSDSIIYPLDNYINKKEDAPDSSGHSISKSDNKEGKTASGNLEWIEHLIW